VFVADLPILVAMPIVETWHVSLPELVFLRAAFCLIERVSNACYHFCYPTPEYWTILEGIRR
jgi:hypothetical protein